MSDALLRRWLGTSRPDPGCDGAFDVLDRYVEALRRGADAAAAFPTFVTHLEQCADCREDTEGLMAALAHLDSTPGR